MKNPLNLSRIGQLKNFGFRITWTLLRMGYYGEDDIPTLFTKKDICMYAMEKIGDKNKILVACCCAQNMMTMNLRKY